MRVTLILAAGLVILDNSAHASPIIQTVDPSNPLDFASVGAAAQAQTAGNTYIINVAPGIYTNDFAEFAAPTVVNGSGVADSTNTAPGNLKGVYSTTSSLTVNGVSFIGTPYLSDASPGSGISLANGANSSAIRDQSNTATTLALNGVTISGFQMGALTSSDSGTTYQEIVTVSNSKFLNNGFPAQSADLGAFGHALYVGDAASLTVTGSTFCGQQVGHDVKSRAQATTVTGSTMFVGTNTGAPSGCIVGSASLGIDIPNGGVGEIDNNQIFQGDANQNGSLVRFGEEGLINGFTNSLDVSNTTFNNLGSRTDSIAIDQPRGCSAPVSGTTTDTFVNTLPVNPPTCLASTIPPVAVMEPTSLVTLGTSLSIMLGLVGWRRRKP